MKALLRQYFEGKKILLLGFGAEGKSSFIMLRELFPASFPAVADINPAVAEDSFFEGIRDKVAFHTGPNYLDVIGKYDVVLKTPGIALSSDDYNAHITSQTALFLRMYRGKFAGITGTKGKSTTSSLLTHIMNKHLADSAILAGNIGVPLFDVINVANGLKTIICELSSHQLEITDASPRIAVLLNIYQEHLDHYGSYEAYQQAKFNITRFQKSGDVLVYNADDAILNRLLSENGTLASLLPFSMHDVGTDGCFVSEGSIKMRRQGIETELLPAGFSSHLRGGHNLYNVMAASATATLLGVAPRSIVQAVASFRGLPHRLEYVGCFAGIHFYNDSIATIPEATIAAVKALHTVDALILGGFDRGVDFSFLAEFLTSAEIANLILMGSAGKRLAELLIAAGCRDTRIHRADSLDEAMEIARKKTKKEGLCLLSPAAASYDAFTDFRARGDRFKKIASSF
jgi:UDP-N-acetylmuramoyl-L-alanine---L-glutamate ligase